MADCKPPPDGNDCSPPLPALPKQPDYSSGSYVPALHLSDDRGLTRAVSIVLSHVASCIVWQTDGGPLWYTLCAVELSTWSGYV